MDAFKNVSVFSLTLAQRLLGLFALGDVANNCLDVVLPFIVEGV